jgi:glycosyltransferase involved in cell wall biosynthesis
MSIATLETAPAPAARVPGRVRRVCLVTEAAGGGVGRHFLDLAEGLARRGVEVVAIYSPGRCDALFRERKAEVAGVQFVELPLRRAVHPADMIDLGKLIRCIRRHGPFDILHGHSSKGGALARLAGRYLKIPAIYTPHAFVTLDPTLSRMKRAIYGGVERWLARRAAGVIAVSPDEASHARALGIDAHQVYVVPNGIDGPQFPTRDDARRKLSLSPNDLIIGFVGRLAPQKAPDVLLEAFARIADRTPSARLVFVGSGPLEATLRQRIDQLGLKSRVLLTGDQVATTLMPAFDIFCLSSRYEGMTYVLLEALRAGLPIVATDVGGVSLCVAEDINGIIVEPGNAAALAEALSRVSNSDATRRRFAGESLARAQRFTADRMVEQTLAIYESAVTRRNHAAF